jgi:hypothetical protein
MTITTLLASSDGLAILTLRLEADYALLAGRNASVLANRGFRLDNIFVG